MPASLNAARRCTAEALEGRVLLATTQVPGFQDGVYSMGYSAPTSMEFAPDGRLFVTQQGGQLRVHLPGMTSPQGPAFLNLTSVTNSAGERGLLSVALDPQFMSNGFVYVYYTRTTPTVHNRISQFKAAPAEPEPAPYRPGNTAPLSSEVVLMDLENLSATNHNGGAMHFGPDGKLYIAVGENAVPSNSQTLSNRLGKMLRINPDGTIPTDNPFYNQASGANRAIWALGLRNPYTFAFEPGTGRMFINDVGQSSFEEVNDGIVGSNYGWPNVEGYRTNQPLPNPLIGTYRDPVLAYGRSVGRTITGGAFYRPPVENFPPQYVGKYFFGDYVDDWIRFIDPSVNRPPIQNFATGAFGPVDYDVGPEGALYYLSIETGVVGRITWAAPRIRTQPTPQSVQEGDPVTFTVVATGTLPLRFQWRRNGEDITGATAASYTLDPTTAADSGARFSVVVTNSFGSVTSDEAMLTVTPAPAEVVGRHVFYNNSFFDGRNPAANDADDGAIAADKRPLLPGQVGSFLNMTGYSRGINGVMVDVAHLPASATITDANFTFATSKTGSKWVDAPARQALIVRRGAGVDGSDRITITWGDGQIVNRWLRVTFTPPTLPATPVNQDVFYYGNLRGETGNPPKVPRQTVDIQDALGTRRALRFGTGLVEDAFDHNRDGRVNVLDYSITQRNRGQSVILFTAPAPPA